MRLKRSAWGGLPERCRIIEGDVLNAELFAEAMVGQDLVCVNLSGQMEAQAKAIIAAMEQTGVQRLIFVSSMELYDEAPT